MLCGRCGCSGTGQADVCPLCAERFGKLDGMESSPSPADAPGYLATPLRYGGFRLRFWAFMLDAAKLGCISVLVLVAGMIIAGPRDGGVTESAGRLFPAQVAADSLMKALYFMCFHAVTGQTVGKKALGLMVVREDGGMIGWARSVVRYAGVCHNTLAFGLGYSWVAFNSRKQGWHDKMAGSFVVRVQGAEHVNPGPGTGGQS